MTLPEIQIPTMEDAVLAALVGVAIGFVLSGILAAVKLWLKRHPSPVRPERDLPPIPHARLVIALEGVVLVLIEAVFYLALSIR